MSNLLEPIPVTQAECEVLARQFTDTLRETLIAKNKAYGGASFTQGFAGSVVHLSDKFNRIKSLLANPDNKAFESISDTALDMAGYSALLYMMLTKKEGRPIPVAMVGTVDEKPKLDKFVEELFLSNQDKPEFFFTVIMNKIIGQLEPVAKPQFVKKLRELVVEATKL